MTNVLKKSFLGPLLGRMKSTRLKYVKFGIRYDQDELITSHYPYFREDSKFIEALTSNFSFDSQPRRILEHDWRIHVLCSLAFNATKNGEGDLIECGVFRGVK